MANIRGSASENLAGQTIAQALSLEDGKWQWRQVDVLDTSSLPETCYIFLAKNVYPPQEKTRELILKPYDVPRILRSDTCTQSNGYFGSKSAYGDQNHLDSQNSHNTWFRCVTKMVWKSGEKMRQNEPYTWYEMEFFTHWDHSGQRRVLCIDTPDYFKLALCDIVSCSKLDANDPFAMLEPLIDELVKLCDNSVWRVRDAIRVLEQHRLKKEPDFEEMQEISRHAIHVREALTMTIEMLENMSQDQKHVYENLGARLARSQWEQALSHLQLQLLIVKSVKERSISNLERLNTEITLAYNVIIQQDSLVMKSIGLLTMTFLPATFVSAFFSTTFFSFSEGGWGGMSKLWVYWVVTIPSTVATLLFFQAWMNTGKRFWLTSTVTKMSSWKARNW